MQKKAGHIGCSHAAICPVYAYSAFILMNKSHCSIKEMSIFIRWV